MDIINIYRKKYAISKGEKAEDFLVDWTPEDRHMDPSTWSTLRRINCTLILTAISFLVTFTSSISAGTYDDVSARFNVTDEVAEMTTSLFLVGFAVGAVVFAPICEEVGRLPVYIGSILIFSCFQIGAAVSRNMATLAICRFFAGFFGTSPLSNAGGSLCDIWTHRERTIMFPLFGVFGFIGPCIGPLAGSYLSKSYLTWRWTNYIVAIVGFFISLISALFMPETYKPVIMDIKAAAIRKQTGDKRYRSAHEVAREGKSVVSLDIFLRPFIFAITQPIVTCFTIYISIAYIILFTDLESFPMIFATWGFGKGKNTLPFIPLTIGVCFTFVFIVPLTYLHYRKMERKYGSLEKIPPEVRLIPLMFVCWGLPISLFWMAWTAYPSISPWPAIISPFPFGVGFMQIFLTSYMYIMDSYGVNSASALSTLTLVRYNVSAGMVHVASPMYKNLGIHWAASLLGFLSLVTCPIPFLFWFFGPYIRSRSRYTARIHESNEEDILGKDSDEGDYLDAGGLPGS